MVDPTQESAITNDVNEPEAAREISTYASNRSQGRHTCQPVAAQQAYLLAERKGVDKNGAENRDTVATEADVCASVLDAGCKSGGDEHGDD